MGFCALPEQLGVVALVQVVTNGVSHDARDVPKVRRPQVIGALVLTIAVVGASLSSCTLLAFS